MKPNNEVKLKQVLIGSIHVVKGKSLHTKQKAIKKQLCVYPINACHLSPNENTLSPASAGLLEFTGGSAAD